MLDRGNIGCPQDPGAIYVMDRGYLDYARLYTIHMSSAIFVTRTKKNFGFSRLYSHRVDRSTGLLCDQTIVLKGFYAKKNYPEKLRRIRYFDTEKNKKLVFLTNNFTLPALTIVELYRCRWQIELFFKWIKQDLRIKAFYGTSENAVKTQIWTALIAILVVKYLKLRSTFGWSLSNLIALLRMNLFTYRDLWSWLDTPFEIPVVEPSAIQLELRLR